MQKNAAQPAPSPQNFLDRLLTSRSKFGQIARRFRRFYYGVFNEEYILKNIEEKRKGECHRCGMCCELVYKCPFLGKDADKLPYCRIYGDLRPANCHNYPFDAVDSEVDQCGFKFDENPKGNRGTGNTGS